jgi:hypothetical protein
MLNRPPVEHLSDAREYEGGILAFSVGGSPWLVDFERRRFQRLLPGTDPEPAILFGTWQAFETLEWDGEGGFAVTLPSPLRGLRVSTRGHTVPTGS